MKMLWQLCRKTKQTCVSDLSILGTLHRCGGCVTNICDREIGCMKNSLIIGELLDVLKSFRFLKLV